MQKQPAAQSTTSEAPQRHNSVDRSDPQTATAPSATVLPESGTRSRYPDERPCGGYVIGGGTFGGGFMLGSGN